MWTTLSVLPTWINTRDLLLTIVISNFQIRKYDLAIQNETKRILELNWSKIDFKVHESKRLVGLEAHEDGV